MPNKLKKEKEPTKKSANGKNGKENNESGEELNKVITPISTMGIEQLSPGNVPPPTQINKIKYPGPPHIKKDKRQSSSRFNISKNRELQKLPLLKASAEDTRAQRGLRYFTPDLVVVVTFVGVMLVLC
ncbi:unnamed protein product [Timema podura]|uniref:Uncharacterized protein n=1 Tax=Timema podura TaxID=61482 RepID=A0ABN7NQK0_TIMPD|nr:unnamed protein product [Timema podura]